MSQISRLRNWKSVTEVGDVFRLFLNNFPYQLAKKYLLPNSTTITIISSQLKITTSTSTLIVDGAFHWLEIVFREAIHLMLLLKIFAFTIMKDQ